MKTDRPSLTAIWVAAWRGLGAYDLPATGHDPIAKTLVPSGYARLLELAEEFPVAARVAMKAAAALTLGMSHHLPFRTRAIDDAVAAEVARGTTQLVLLGAGLDARAYRLPGLAAVDVFEVDFPSTQRYKRSAIGTRAHAAKSLRYVGIDFMNERLSTRLIAEGFDRARAAIFVWEGVTMYLGEPAIAATLDELNALAASRSLLCVTYQTDDLQQLRNVANLVFALVGEPMLHRSKSPAFAALLAQHGFVVESDEGDRQWAARYGHRFVLAPMTERLALARR